MRTLEYKEEYGKISFPDGFQEKLIGKSIEEQMELFRIRDNTIFTESSYGEITRQSSSNHLNTLEEHNGLKGLITKEGIIVGVILTSWNSSKDDLYCFPGQTVNTYYDCDDDGPGSSERGDFATLICQ